MFKREIVQATEVIDLVSRYKIPGYFVVRDDGIYKSEPGAFGKVEGGKESE